MTALRLFALSLLAACSAPALDDAADETRGTEPVTQRLFRNGTIYQDPELAPVEALLVRDGRVVVGGDLAAVRAEVLGPCDEIDLRGAVAVPGLQDAHGHFEGLGKSLEDVRLADTRSYEEVIARVAAQAARQPAGTWITGRGWDQSRWPENAFPTHEALSRAVPEHPVWIRRVDGHAALANERALALAGLHEADDLPQPEGGRVVLDDAGRPTGVLVDTAMSLVGSHVPEPDRATRRRRFLLAQRQLLAEGLVCVHDMGVDGDGLAILEELERTGELALRVVAYLSAGALEDPELRARYPRPADRDPASTLRVIGTKLYMDGAMGSRGAALLEPYADAPGEVGLLRMEGAALEALVDTAAEAGLQPAVHAIGDRANRLVLDAFESRMARDAGFRALRPRVEHAQLVAADDWARFGAAGIVPSMQPRHATSDMHWAEDRVGTVRAAGAYAWRRLGSERAPLAFGSDFPVEPSAPLLGLYAARTRRDEEGSPPGGWRPDQRLDGIEALAAFTSGAAWAAHEEDRRGRLEPGYFADLTVLDVDPIYGEPQALLTARVLLTVVDGEIVYDGHDEARR